MGHEYQRLRWWTRLRLSREAPFAPFTALQILTQNSTSAAHCHKTEAAGKTQKSSDPLHAIDYGCTLQWLNCPICRAIRETATRQGLPSVVGALNLKAPASK